MKRAFAAILAAAALGGLGWLIYARVEAAPPADRLYGNVEIRQVDLAFNSEGAVLTMAKREGDRVAAGEPIAELDSETYRHAADLAAARREAAQAGLAKLLNGSRQEDIEQARANAINAHAVQIDAQITYNRQATLGTTSAVSKQEVDDAKRQLDVANAQVKLSEAALAELVNGARVEDIDAARAQLREAQASEALSKTQLARATLKAPCDGIVMTRVIEPGTVVMPTSIVYSIAITGEVWVRAFVPETLLARAAPNAGVLVYTDARPGKPYHGIIGYVSPQAEFTPKTVETPELRTQLVYRLRVRLTDADDGIRQGQPVTIDFLPATSP